MINTSRPRWYHSIMPSFGKQVAVLFACFFIIFFQGITYEILEDDIIVFSGECVLEPVLDDDGIVTSSLTAQCGEYTYNLDSNQERLVHFRELTTGVQPVIFCERTVSEYLKQVNWTCIFDPESENNAEET